MEPAVSCLVKGSQGVLRALSRLLITGDPHLNRNCRI